MASEKGIILITTLLFMQIFMLIGLFTLQNSFLIQMVAHEFQKKTEQTKKSLELLSQVEKSDYSRCIIPAISRSEIVSKSHDWWLQTGCQGVRGQSQYIYIFESLDEDACAYQNTAETGLSAYYFRISLLIFSDKNRDEKQILQSTIVKMDNAKLTCTEKFRQIVPGRQMWQILI